MAVAPITYVQSTDILVFIISLLVLSFLLQEILKSQSKNQRRINSALKNIPGPSRYPIIGNAYLLVGKYVQEVFSDCVKRYGPCFKFWTLGKLNIVLSDHKTFAKILTSTEVTDKGGEYEKLTIFLGHGMLTSKGDSWRNQRKLLTPSFHKRLFDDFVKICDLEAKTLVELLQKDFQVLPKGKEINILRRLTLCAMDTVFRTSIGQGLELQFGAGKPIVDSLDFLNEAAGDIIFKPWRAHPVIAFFNGMTKKIDESIATIRGALQSVLSERRLQLQNLSTKPSPSKVQPITDLMISLPDLFTDEDCIDQLTTIATAGSLTTADSVHFTLFLLALCPEYQAKVQEEIDQVLQGSNKITLECLGKLEFLEMCLKESMRLYPPVPIITSMNKFGPRLYLYTILDNGITLPKGVDVALLIYDLHRDPAVYPNPEKFDPERFRKGKDRPPCSYVPFSSGIRNCIGYKFAMLEAKTILAHVLNKFSLTTTTTSDLKYIYTIPVDTHPRINFNMSLRK